MIKVSYSIYLMVVLQKLSDMTMCIQEKLYVCEYIYKFIINKYMCVCVCVSLHNFRDFSSVFKAFSSSVGIPEDFQN